MLFRQRIKTVTHVVEVLRFAQNRKRRHAALSFLQGLRRGKLQMNRLSSEDLKEERWWQPHRGVYQRFHCTADRRPETPRFHLRTTSKMGSREGPNVRSSWHQPMTALTRRPWWATQLKHLRECSFPNGVTVKNCSLLKIIFRALTSQWVPAKVM
jgi:hypothetical protein